MGDRDRLVIQDFLINQGFNGRELVRAEARLMGEIKAQAFRPHPRALLGHMLTEHAAQGGVQQVRGAVVADGGGPGRSIHFRREFGHGLVVDQAVDQAATMDVHFKQLESVGDIEFNAIPNESAHITNLAAGLGVERRLVKAHENVVAHFPIPRHLRGC